MAPGSLVSRFQSDVALPASPSTGRVRGSSNAGAGDSPTRFFANPRADRAGGADLVNAGKASTPRVLFADHARGQLDMLMAQRSHDQAAADRDRNTPIGFSGMTQAEVGTRRAELQGGVDDCHA